MTNKEDPMEKARRLREEGQRRAHSPERLAVASKAAQQMARSMYPELSTNPEEKASKEINATMHALQFSTRERKKIAAFAAEKGITEVEAVRELALKGLAGK